MNWRHNGWKGGALAFPERMEWLVVGWSKALMLQINLFRPEGLCGQERRR